MENFLRRLWYDIKKTIWIVIAGFELLILTFILSQDLTLPIYLIIILGCIFIGITAFVGLILTTNFMRKYFCTIDGEAKIIDSSRRNNNDDGISTSYDLVTYEYVYKNKTFRQIVKRSPKIRVIDSIVPIKICNAFPKMIYIMDDPKEYSEKTKKPVFAFGTKTQERQNIQEIRLLKPDVDKRREYLKTICKSKKSWKARIILHAFCMFLAVGIVISGIVFICFIGIKEIGLLAGILVATLIAALLPYLIGLSVKNSAKYKCAEPYSGMANGHLYLEEDVLKYVYWMCSEYSPEAYSSKKKIIFYEEKKCECIFLKKDITSVYIDEFHVCHIKGSGIKTVPGEFDGDARKQRKLKKFDFLVAFEPDDSENVIKMWHTTGVYNG